MIMSWRTIAVLVFVCSARVDAQGPEQKRGDRPKALEMMEQARTAVISGTVEWTVADSERTPGRTFRYINRYAANGDRVTEHRGDQDGWVGWDPQENKPVNKFPKLFLQNGKGVFETTETGPTVRWWLPKAELPDGEHRPPPDASDWMDIRSIGMIQELATSAANGPDSLWVPPSFRINEQAPPEIEWSESRRADKHVLTCRRSDGVEIEWTIDPERGWNAERVIATDKHASRTIELRSDFRKYGDTWIVEKAEFLVDGQSTKTVRVISAAFNQPDDEPRFDFAWLRKEAGTNVSFYNAPNKDGVQIWDGEAIVSFKEWREALLSGKRQARCV